MKRFGEKVKSGDFQNCLMQKQNIICEGKLDINHGKWTSEIISRNQLLVFFQNMNQYKKTPYSNKIYL
jgi:hypothetical protein